MNWLDVVLPFEIDRSLVQIGALDTNLLRFLNSRVNKHKKGVMKFREVQDVIREEGLELVI